ncbi:RNA polymerase sigma factor [Spirochaetota bacterium]
MNDEKIIELYNKYSKELLIYIYKIMGSQETAEDILHDSFVNLMKYSENHKIIESTVKAFLYKTAHNLSVNSIKKNRRIQFTSIENKDFQANENVSANIELEELNNKIYEFLENLDTLSKSIFIMKKELNMGNKEISINTGISERTVRRKLKTALDYLSTELKKSGLI